MANPEHPDDEKIEYKPHDNTDIVRDDYRVHVYPPENGIVPDVIIWIEEDDERVRLWGFQGYQAMLVYVVHTDHQHPPDYEQDCRKWTLFDDKWPSLQETDLPARVSRIAADVSDAPLVDKSQTDDSGKDADER